VTGSLRTSEIKLVVSVSPSCAGEKKYTIRWILEEVFGFQVFFEKGEAGTIIRHTEYDGSLSCQDTFFEKAGSAWLSSKSIPSGVSYVSPGSLGTLPLPVMVYGEEDTNNSLFEKNGKVGQLNLDLFGTVFFLISRY